MTPATPSKPHARRRKDPPQSTGRQRTATASTDPQRERILQTAAQLFAAQGYVNTTMAQIAHAMGATKPFVYYYFRNKQEIFERLWWRPAVEFYTSMDFAKDDKRPAVVKVKAGIERLIRAAIKHRPCTFLDYKDPQVYRPEYLAAEQRLANHFRRKLFQLLEQASADGDLDFAGTRVSAFAALSPAGFLHTWYRPDGRLSPDELVAELSRLSWRVLGLRESEG